MEHHGPPPPPLSAPPEFHCRRCGACCRIPGGIVRVSDEEISRLAAALHLSEAEFVDRHTDLAPDRLGLVLQSRPDGACVLLSESNGCLVHSAKPDQCRTFPLGWHNTDSEATCPGYAEMMKQNRPNA